MVEVAKVSNYIIVQYLTELMFNVIRDPEGGLQEIPTPQKVD